MLTESSLVLHIRALPRMLIRGPLWSGCEAGYNSADEFVVSMAMRPKPTLDSESRRHSAQDEVLMFIVNTLLMRMRACVLKKYFVVDLGPKSFSNAGQVSPEGNDLRFDLIVSWISLAERELQLATHHGGRDERAYSVLRAVSRFE